jgi:hypothetical protein
LLARISTSLTARKAATLAVAKEKKLSVVGSSCRLAESAITLVVATGSLMAAAAVGTSEEGEGFKRDRIADIMSEI